MAHIQKRNGKYQARYPAPDGQERSRRFDRKIDAERWLATNTADIARGAWLDPKEGRVTLTDFANDWLARRNDLAERTRELYRFLLDRYVLAGLGSTPISALRPSAVASWNAGVAVKHPSTAAKAYRLLSTIMRAAVADRVIAANPCQVHGAAHEKAPERPTASIAEVQALADAMPGHLRIAVLLGAWCQLRRAELLGLQRKDVSVLGGTVSVVRTRTKTMAGTIVEKPPKTEAGRRTVAVPANVLPALREHLNTYVGSDPDALVLVGEKGAALIPGVLHAAWDRARQQVGRRDLRFHDLRHSGLTWSAATGATVAELMRRAGHSSPAAALRYQHATSDRDRAIANALAELAEMAQVVPIDEQSRQARGRDTDISRTGDHRPGVA